jgi:hypothetical protein
VLVNAVLAFAVIEIGIFLATCAKSRSSCPFVVSSDGLNRTTRHCQRSVVESLVGHPMQYNDMLC